jgi:glycosyltransferase involved in cell wall biosynthesis
MGVVLSMITRDSHRLGRIFTEALMSSLQVPYNTLVLVDDSTTDATRQLVKEFANNYNKELIILSSRDIERLRPGVVGVRPTRAVARQVAIDFFLQNTSDEWLMFLDDDAVLNDGWCGWVVKNKVLEDPSIGEVWGVNYDVDPARERAIKALGIDLVNYLIRKFEVRGGTHDTLFRRGALVGVFIPPELHVYEDAWLHHYVRCRGWNYAVNPVGVRHYSPWRIDMRKEMERLRLGIHVAVKYGIVEYETMQEMKQAQHKKVLAYLSLLRPVLGLPLQVYMRARAYGLKDGIKDAFKRQYLKLWFRYQVLKALRDLEHIPDPCESILSTHQGN